MASSKLARFVASGVAAKVGVVCLSALSFFLGTRWEGQDTEKLTLDDAIAVIRDGASSEQMVINASSRVYVLAKQAIGALVESEGKGGRVSPNARVWLKHLGSQIPADGGK